MLTSINKYHIISSCFFVFSVVLATRIHKFISYFIENLLKMLLRVLLSIFVVINVINFGKTADDEDCEGIFQVSSFE